MKHIEAHARRYAEKPSRLVELCREVVQQLTGGEYAAMETQLREIARTVTNLERQGVPVPDVLRAEKIRLAAALEAMPDNSETLELLAGGLEAVAKEIKSHLRRKNPATERTQRISTAGKTPNETFRRLILEVLDANGGQTTAAEVYKTIERRLQDQFLPGDLEIIRKGHNQTLPSWQERVRKERERMVRDGLLRNDSPKGVWELP